MRARVHLGQASNSLQGSTLPQIVPHLRHHAVSLDHHYYCLPITLLCRLWLPGKLPNYMHSILERDHDILVVKYTINIIITFYNKIIIFRPPY